MYVSLVFACGLATTLLAALTVVRYLSGPLRAQLKELCGNAERAEFWTAFSSVTVILTPAIFAIPADPSAASGTPALLAIVSQLRWGLIGLVISVLMLGWILGRFIPKTLVVRPGTLHPESQSGAAL
jgi:hypothetical protein